MQRYDVTIAVLYIAALRRRASIGKTVVILIGRPAYR